MPPRWNRRFAAQLDALLRRTCQIARALTGAEQAALKLWVGEASSQARKYFSLSKKYAAFRDFRVDPKGYWPARDDDLARRGRPPD